MTFDELMQEIEKLPNEQLRLLQERIEQRMNTESKIAMLHEAIDALREGLSEDEIEEMVQAMNAEYIEPFDENEWKT